VTINQAVGQADPTNSGTVAFTADFSEPVTGFTNSDVTTSGTAAGSWSVGITGTGPSYTVTISGATGNGTITASIGASTIQDLAGNNNTASTSTENTVTLDTALPTVTNVSSSTSDGSYKAGVVIPVTVTFSEPVTVTGTPQLTLSTGTPATTAVSYTSGTGTSTLTFNYTVAANNTSADLTYQATTSLGLNGGTIRDAATNDATLTLAGPAAAGSLGFNKNIVIDTTAPTLTSIVRAGGSASVNTGPLSWTVTFTEPVSGVATSNFGFVTSGITGTPTFTSATPSGSSPSATWTILTGEAGVTGTNVGSIGLNLTSVGSIADVATNGLSASLPLTGPAYTYDTNTPTVVGVSSTSVDGGYKAGSVIPVTVTFSEAVTVTGTPTLTLATGSPGTTGVTYSSGSGTAVLTFQYTVLAGHVSPDLDYAAATSLAAGTAIKDAATNNAVLTLASPGAPNSLGANKNLVIDGIAPTLVSATSGGGTLGLMETGDTISLTFSEALATTSVPTSVTVTEHRQGTATLTIPGLIQPAAISNSYLAANNATATAPSTSVVLSNGNKTVTITLGTVTGGGMNTGSGAVSVQPEAALTDVVGNGAGSTSASITRLF